MKISPADHCVALLARCVIERDSARATALAEEYGRAVVEAASETWGEKLDAARTMLDQAERSLAKAARADTAERRRHLRIFEMTTLSAEKLAGLGSLGKADRE